MKFSDKPVARIAVVWDDGHETEGNIAADHLQEHLERAGFIAEVDCRKNTGIFSAFGGVGFRTEEPYAPRFEDIFRIVNNIRRAHLSGVLAYVFGLDNPENAAYGEVYAPKVTVWEAVKDTRAREGLYDLYYMGY